MTNYTPARGKPSTRPPHSSSRQWDSIVDVFQSNFDNPDTQAIRGVYAAFAAHDLSGGQPVWPLLIGPPGSLKTVLLSSLEGLPNVHLVDQVTKRTFISGYRPPESRDGEDDKDPKDIPDGYGLLFRIGDSGKLIIPDFSTISAISADDKKSILSDLRRIYDGYCSKEFGTGKLKSETTWRGRITCLAAGTDDVDRQYTMFSSLGERFLLIRWPRAGLAAAQRAVKQDQDVIKLALRVAAYDLLDGLENTDAPILPAELEENAIPALGDFIAYSRSGVIRDYRGKKEIIHVPEPESATRISQQLCQLAKGSALLDRHDMVSDYDYSLVKRVAFDCLPPARCKVLRRLIYDDASQTAGMPASTVHYATEDLVALGVLSESVVGVSLLSKRTIEQLKPAGLM